MTELKKYFDKNKDDRNVSCMLKLVHAVSSAGGKAYVVGGTPCQTAIRLTRNQFAKRLRMQNE